MHRRPIVLAACALALAACGDYGAPSEVINGTAVATAQLTGANFSQYTTYTVTNTVQVYTETGSSSQPSDVDASQLIPTITAQMNARGYTYVPFTPGVRADLVISLYAYKGTQAYGGTYCGWYYWGYYPYDCYWGYYGTYNTGTFVMQMGDFKNAPPAASGAKLATVWGSAAYAVASTAPYNYTLIQSSIVTAFNQSPYLKRN